VARYQAATWNHAELMDNEYLMNGGFWGVGNVLDWMYNADHWQDYSSRPRFQALAPQLRDRELLLNAHRKLKRDWWTYTPLVLAHGDAHVGQLYEMPDGEIRLLDWQCVRMAHWGFDPCNILVSGLTIDDRRRFARDLLQGYVRKLGEFGVEHPPTVEDAFRAMRAYTIHALGWVMCMVEMQPEENCMAITERASAAAIELETVETIMAGPQALQLR
jgi:thiamine kinase-like enzyme